MISVVMILTKVSFAGASLVTSFFLARRGKAFLEPGQDLEAAVNRYMNEYSYSMIFMIFTSMTNDQIKSIYSLARCWPTLLRPLRFSPLKQRFLWKKYCIFSQIDDWRIILVIKHELVQYGIYSFFLRVVAFLDLFLFAWIFSRWRAPCSGSVFKVFKVLLFI